MREKLNRIFKSKASIAVFLILFVASCIIFSSRNFGSFNSVMNLLKKGASDGGFLALGMTFVILIGEIDLSVGSVLAMGGVVMAMFGAENPVLGIILGLTVGLVCGFLNGFMVAKMKISSWIATLAMMLAVRGLVMILTSEVPVSISNPTLLALGGSSIGRVNILIIILTVLTLVCMYVSKYTRFGMAVYAVGGNQDAAKMMGLNTDAVIIAAYTICGVMAALAGMLLACKLYTAQPTAGDSWETTAIAMCALGGVKLSGGEGRFSGTFFGVLIIATINTIFNYAGSLNSWWQNIVMGVLILISIGLQSEVIHLPSLRRKTADEKGGA